jgi:hypothetical protein
MDVDGDGCPSVIDGDGGANALLEYAGTVDGTGNCQVATTTTTIPPIAQEPAGSELLSVIKLEPPILGMLPEALITSYRIVALSPSLAASELYVSDRPVDRAIVGDINGDGRTDAVLSTDSPNLDLVRRVPNSSLFLLSRQSTTGAVTLTLIGDFDGDQLGDLAYNERLGSEDQLSIAYGTPGGVLPGIAVDAFNRLQFLAVMDLTDSVDPFGIVDDLLAIDVDVSPGDVGVDAETTLLHGSPNRTMLSFYGNPVPERFAPFRGVVAGNFVERDDSIGVPDLMAFQTRPDGAAVIHVIPGLPNGRLGEAEYRDGLLIPPSPSLGSCPAGPQRSFCLELAAFTSFSVPGKPDVVLGVDVRSGQSPHVVRIEPTAAGLDIRIFENIFDARGRLYNVEDIDVDHDGRNELVASFERSSPDAHDDHVAICQVDDNVTIVSCLDVASDVLHDSTLICTSFARGQVTPPCEHERDRPADAEDLVVSCTKPGVRDVSKVIHIRQQDGALVGWRVLVEDEARYDDLQLGDVSGDGLDDLVIVMGTAGISQLQVRRQWPSRESNLCFE